jgi:hypothetical protein
MNGNEPWRKISNISKIVRNRKNGSLRMKKREENFLHTLKELDFSIFLKIIKDISFILYIDILYIF